MTHPSVPESGSAVRVRDYYSEMVIKAHTLIEEPGMNYELTYFDDPQVRLPSSCVNWVANSGKKSTCTSVYILHDTVVWLKIFPNRGLRE